MLSVYTIVNDNSWMIKISKNKTIRYFNRFWHERRKKDIFYRFIPDVKSVNTCCCVFSIYHLKVCFRYSWKRNLLWLKMLQNHLPFAITHDFDQDNVDIIWLSTSICKISSIVCVKQNLVYRFPSFVLYVS